MVTVFFYLHTFTGSVRRRILIVVPVDTLYRTSIISSSTVLLLNPFANLSLAPLSLFSIYGPDLGVWPDCWVSTEFLRAPIPRKGSGSTTTTHHQLACATQCWFTLNTFLKHHVTTWQQAKREKGIIAFKHNSRLKFSRFVGKLQANANCCTKMTLNNPSYNYALTDVSRGRNVSL